MKLMPTLKKAGLEKKIAAGGKLAFQAFGLPLIQKPTPTKLLIKEIKSLDAEVVEESSNH